MSMSLLEQLGERRVGIALHVIAWIFLFLAAWLMWTSVERWLGIAALEKAQAASLAGKRSVMLEAGRDAAAYLPTTAAAAILAIDWDDPNASATIEQLITKLPKQQQPHVKAMLAIHQRTHHVKNPLALEDSNGLLLSMADSLAAGKSATWPTYTAPPHAVVQCYAAQWYFKAMWEQDNRDAIRQAAGSLRLLMPQHPDIRLMCLISEALSSSGTKDMILKNAKPHPGENGARIFSGIIRKIVTLAPERSELLLPLIPAALRNPSENESLLGNDLPLERQVDDAMRKGTDQQLVLAVIERCLNQGDYDAARKLVATLPDPQRSESAKAIAEAAGDLATLQQLTLDAGYTPTLYALQKNPGVLRFHVLSPANIIPTAPIVAVIGGKKLAPEQITRIGSLVQINLGEQRGNIVLTCDGATIYSGVVP